jgi:SAM-dependent methyltransferase
MAQSSIPDIHIYWATTHLLPILREFDFSNDREFHCGQTLRYLREAPAGASRRILSIGCTDGALEIDLADRLTRLGVTDFQLECLSGHSIHVDQARQRARQLHLDRRISFADANMNELVLDGRYGIVIANQSLHHYSDLEHIFGEVQRSLDANGRFLVHDVVGRNGRMRWPEAVEIIRNFWAMLPKRCTYNHLRGRFEDQFVNQDYSDFGFEGHRTQDILPLLGQFFQFDLFVPYANVIDVFIDQRFGPNFSASNPWDRELIDLIHRTDHEAQAAGMITPGHVFASMGVSGALQTRFPVTLSPAVCTRDTTDVVRGRRTQLGMMDRLRRFVLD